MYRRAHSLPADSISATTLNSGRIATVLQNLDRLQSVSPRDGSAVLASARQVIDAETHTVARLLCSIKTRHNTLSMVSLLSPEILAHILEFHAINCPFAPDDSLKDSSRYGRNRFLGWISATHVCRHWRYVALEHVVLWSKISLARGSFWSDFMLARAQHAPLFIEGTNLPDRPAPLLEGLKLVAGVQDRIAIVLPPNLFADTLPKLTSISMHDYVFPWTSLPTGRLSHLDITLSRWSRTEVCTVIPSFEQLMDFLRKSSSLRTVHLRYCLPHRNQSLPVDFLETSTLPSLELLALAEPSAEVVDLLAHITSPSSTKLHMTSIFDSEPTQMQPEPLLSLIAAHLDKNPEQSLHFPTAVSLEDQDYLDTVSLEAWKTLLPLGQSCNRSVCEESDISIKLEWPDSYYKRTAFLSMCNRLPIWQAQRLSLNIDWRASDKTWFSLFGRMSSVKHLHLCNIDHLLVSDVLQRLNDADAGRILPTERSTHTGKPIVLFPEVEFLFVRNIEFDWERLAESWSVCFERRELGSPLKYLDIAGTCVPEELVVRFKAVIPTFAWAEGSYDYDDPDF
ncbi:hypothetical protein BV25DRAFT_1901185 [Artomyces pyxidatus]|uniref:Uncharacterized protein n=1 Tax=Artomyces pyxidatus TaxID=48021 RepID=A0ACB8SVU9_9AGAM|nr:hypothetical protein BV25DRAFT_1901185 [Artomyces pyxidatus]